MPDWKFVTATTPPEGSETIDILRGARARKVTFRRRGGADAAFAINGRDPGLAGIYEYQTDLLVYRDKRLMFRGRIAPAEDSGEGHTHEVQMAALDYRELLTQVRLVEAPLSYTAQTKKQIVAALLAHTQGQPGGDLGITMGSTPGPAGTHDRDYELAKPIGAAIDDLSTALLEVNRFDWEVDADLRLQMYAPTRGTTKEFVAEVGHNILGWRRGINPGTYANVMIGTGDPDTTTPYIAEATDITTRIEGRFVRTFNDPDIKEQATLEERTDAELFEAQVIQPAYSHTLAANAFWNPEVVWVGDVTPIVNQSGRLNVVSAAQVEELSVDITDDDDEIVSLVYGARRRGELTVQLRQMRDQLAALERR